MKFEVTFTIEAGSLHEAQELVRKMYQAIITDIQVMPAPVIYESGTSRWDEHFYEQEDD